MRESVIDGHFDGLEPVMGFGLDAQRISDDFLGAPVEDDAKIQPAPWINFDFGHVDAPEVIGVVGSGFCAHRSATSPQALKFGDDH